MTTFYIPCEPDRVESVTVTLQVKWANGHGEYCEERHFSEQEHGRDGVEHLAGLIARACALAGKLKPNED